MITNIPFHCFAAFVGCIGFSAIVFAAESCPDGSYRVRAHGRRAYYRADGTFVRSTQVKSFCKVRTVISDTWRPRLQNGLPTDWPHRQEKPADWTTEQEQRVVEALESVPEILRESFLGRIHRSRRSIEASNSASWSEGIIVLYDLAFEPQKNLTRVLSHEFSHELYATLSSDRAGSYRRTAEWKPQIEDDGRIFWRHSKSRKFVEDDGANGPSEDFANNLEYFLFSPTTLKSKNPAIYKWFKDNYGDRLKLENVGK